jgi:nucleoside-diphosphate-sugar epimerase
VHELKAIVRRLAAEGSACRLDRLTPVAGDLRLVNLGGLGLAPRDLAEIDTIVHAGANTSFTASAAELHAVNVDGTARMLALAARCPRLRQFLFVSTACVAGHRTGVIAERLELDAPDFVNAYEASKWRAEQLVAASDLPVRIARLSTCLGDGRTGYVHRFGAVHHTINWLMRGLVPMIPGAPGARIDAIATDVAARWIAHAAVTPVAPRDAHGVDVCHVAAGQQAVPLEALLAAAVAEFRRHRPEWSRRQIEPPAIVDRETFALFQRSAAASGDALFARVLESVQSFLPALLSPKVYETARAERCWGGPLPHPDWRETLAKVIEFGCAAQWSRAA